MPTATCKRVYLPRLGHFGHFHDRHAMKRGHPKRSFKVPAGWPTPVLPIDYAKALTLRKVYEEALETFVLIKPEDVVDPAAVEHAVALARGPALVSVVLTSRTPSNPAGRGTPEGGSKVCSTSGRYNSCITASVSLSAAPVTMRSG